MTNVIHGTSASEAVNGTSGDDSIIASGGNDTLTGGGGNDTFAFAPGQFGNDTITDFIQGEDKIDLSAFHIADMATLGYVTIYDGADATFLSFTENGTREVIDIQGVSSLNLTASDFIFYTSTSGTASTGTNSTDFLFGGVGNDTLHGGGGDDQLIADAGNDYLDGGSGNDVLLGGLGNDTFAFTAPDFGQDSISDFISGTDKIDLSALHIADFATLLPFFTENSSNARIQFTYDGHAESILIAGVIPATGLTGADFIFNTSAAALDVQGTTGNDVLFGGNGSDTLHGYAGDDTLSGGLGQNYLYGGSGNDTYYVMDYGTVVSEESTGPGVDDGGTDLVYSEVNYTLGNFIENLTLLGAAATGTGNGLDNVITGNSNNNALMGLTGNDTLFGGAGDDTLTGGSGADLMYGGAGNDVYYVDNVADVVSEQTASGIDDGGHDIVYSTAASFTLGAFIEDLTLQGTSDVNGAGNGLANIIHGNNGNNDLAGLDGNDTLLGGGGNDSLNGGTGNDYLDGGTGSDTIIGGIGDDTLMAEGSAILHGGAGNDTYYVANASDIVSEATTPGVDDGGTDIVYASVGYILSDFVENLTLTAAAGNANGTGNGLTNIIHGNNFDNILTGLDGNDSLLGGGGNDTLVGGNGNDYLDGGDGNNALVGGAGNDTLMAGASADAFVFAAAGTANGFDQIYSFVHGTDILQFTGADYGFSANHALTTAQLTVGTGAVGSAAQFVWNPTSQTLYWDHDGAGGDAAVAIATFHGTVTVDASDFHFT